MPDPIDPHANPPVPTPTPAPVTPGDADEKLGEPGLKALQSERDARTKAEKDLADARAALQKIEDAKLSDIEKAQKERDDAAAEAAQLRTDNARLAALAKHPVPAGYQDLVTGTDVASFEASAKKISDLYAKAEGKAPRPDPVPSSGSRDGSSSNNSAGTSLDSGRDLYNSKHKKSN